MQIPTASTSEARNARTAKVRAEIHRRAYDSVSYVLLLLGGIGGAVVAIGKEPLRLDAVFMVVMPLLMGVHGLARQRRPLVAWIAYGIVCACLAVWLSLRWSLSWGLAFAALIAVLMGVRAAVMRHQTRTGP